MPITGKFLADFSSFQDAVTKAEISLRSFETSASKVEKSLNKMTDSFSGRKIITEAELAVRAVNDIGGASKLTESEQRRLNATVTEAIAKYNALGYAAPKDMIALADATKRVEQETSKIPSTIQSLASAFGIAFSIGAVVNFGRQVFDTAANVHDMAEQLGLSIEAVQGFKFAAEQGGSSLESVGTAITRMNNNLAEGDKSTVQALAKAGLQFDAIRQLRPEDAFLAITDAIKKIPDPMIQSRVAMELFGRGAADLLPAIKEGFRDIADSASKMSTQTVKSLEAAGDAWDRLKTVAMNNAAEQVGFFIRIFQLAPQAVHNAFALMHLDTDAAAEDFKDLGRWVGAFTRQLEKLPNVTVSDSVKRAFSGAAAPKIHLSSDELADIENDLNREREALDKASKSADAHADTIRDLAKEYAGFTAISAAKDAVAAVNVNLRNGIGLAEMSREKQAALNKTLLAGLEAYKLQGKVAPQAMRDIYLATIQLPPAVEGLANGFEHFGHNVELSIPSIRTVLDLLPRVESGIGNLLNDLPKLDLKYQFERPKPALVDLNQELARFEGALGELAQIAGGAFGSVVGNISTLLGSLREARQGVSDLKNGMKDYKEGSTFQGILGLSSGIAELLAAAIQAGKAIFNLFDRNKGRDAVVDFAKSFGGFDALHEQLLTLGEAGEALWIKLTQGVGRNNPEQAARVIDEVTRALDKQADQQNENTAATEEQAQATIETASQAAAALDELGLKLKTNEDEWAEWSKSVTEDIDRIAQALRTLSLPGVSPASPAQPPSDSGDIPGFASGTRGQYLNFGSGTLAVLHGRERVMTEGEAGTPQVIEVRSTLMLPDYRVLAEGLSRTVLQ